jgi:hypothetical protein
MAKGTLVREGTRKGAATTINGWFGASAPADGQHITAVRASSPSKATVTLEDGRVFNTENGGVA